MLSAKGRRRMNSVRLRKVSDSRGEVRVVVPVSAPNREVEIVLEWRDATGSKAVDRGLGDAADGWPEGWFESIEGSLADDPTFRRPEQWEAGSVEPLA
jgi:hypothetical protein